MFSGNNDPAVINITDLNHSYAFPTPRFSNAEKMGLWTSRESGNITNMDLVTCLVNTG